MVVSYRLLRARFFSALSSSSTASRPSKLRSQNRPRDSAGCKRGVRRLAVQESQYRVSHRRGRLPLREMADAIEHRALVARGEEALLAFRSGGVVARVAAAMDDQRRNADVRVARKLRLESGVSRIRRRQPPPYTVGMQHDVRPV